MIRFGPGLYLVQTLGPLTSWTWTYNLGPGPPVSGPGPRHLGSSPVKTWVCQVQDHTSDSLDSDSQDVIGGTQVSRWEGGKRVWKQ